VAGISSFAADGYDMKRLVSALWIAGGSLSVATGILGIFLPVLPTTPFMLLAAFCYARSSPRCHHWLLHNRWFGAYIRNYRAGRGMPIQQKTLTIAVLWVTIGATAIYALTTWWGRALLLAVASAVTIHLVCIKTCKEGTAPARLEAAGPSEAIEPDQA
jgi:hypothetical protein